MPHVDPEIVHACSAASANDASAERADSDSTDDSRVDRSVMLHLVSTELGHELTHTSNFLRYLITSLRAGPADGQAIEEVRGFADRESERMEQILSHLRRFRIPSPDLAPTDLQAILERSISRLRAGAAQATPVIRLADESGARALTHAGHLGTVMQHLLSHAASNRPTDGGVVVRTALVCRDGEDRVQIDVVDDGPPPAECKAAVLFDAWGIASEDRQARRRAIAFRLLRSVDGTLEYLRSEQFNVFRITLPVAHGAAS